MVHWPLRNDVFCIRQQEPLLNKGGLAQKIGHGDKVVFSHIEAVLDRYNGEDPLLLSAKLMELLQEYRFVDPAKYAALSKKAATKASAGRAHQNPNEGLQTLKSQCISLSRWDESHTITRLRLRCLILEYTFSGGYAKNPKSAYATLASFVTHVDCYHLSPLYHPVIPQQLALRSRNEKRSVPALSSLKLLFFKPFTGVLSFLHH